MLVKGLTETLSDDRREIPRAVLEKNPWLAGGDRRRGPLFFSFWRSRKCVPSLAKGRAI